MKMRNIIIVFLSTFFSFISCKKETELTMAEGYIYHSGTKKPLEGVKVYIYDGLPNSNKGSSRADSTITNTSGFFHIELEAEEPILYPYKKDFSFEYEMGGAVIGIVPIKKGENRNLKFELDARAYINPWFKGTKSLPVDSIIFFLLNKIKIKIGTETTYLGNGPHKFSSFDGYLTKGDTYKSYWIKYQIHGVWNERIDSIYVPSFTTYSDTIYY